MVYLSISSRSFYRELHKGTDEIALYLRHAEHEAQSHPAATETKSIAQQGTCLPPSPPPYSIVGRQGLFDVLLAKLAEPNAQRVALHGLPGVGKTTAVSALIDQPKLASLFPDRVIWLNVGPKPAAVNPVGP